MPASKDIIWYKFKDTPVKETLLIITNKREILIVSEMKKLSILTNSILYFIRILIRLNSCRSNRLCLFYVPGGVFLVTFL